jgi:hypothetical protein
LIFSAKQRVARTELLILYDGPHARRFRFFADCFRLMADHYEDAFRWRNRERDSDRMPHQRFAARMVQHFGETRFHARALARGEYDYGRVWEHVSRILFKLPV